MLLNFSFNVVSFVFLLTTITSFVLFFITLSKKGIAGIRYFSAMSFSFFFWGLLCVLEYSSSDIAFKILCSKISYIGVTTATIHLLLFVVIYTGITEKISLRYFQWLYVFSAFFIIAAFTNDYHWFLWKSYSVRESLNGESVYYESGLGVWILAVGSWTAFVIAMYLMVRASLKNHRKYRRQTVLLLLAFVFPWISNMTYMFRILPYSEIDWTPGSFTISAILVYINISSQNLFNISPLAKDVLFDSIKNAIIVVNNKYIITDCNPEAQRLFGANNHIAQPINNVFAELPINQIDKSNTDIELQRSFEGENRWFHLSVSKINNKRNDLLGYVLLFNDVTENKLNTIKILENNQQISLLNAAKDKFLSIIGHDLQSPFNAILGMSDIVILKMQNNEIAQSKEYAQRIKKSASHAHDLLENLLFWANSQSGLIAFNPQLNDLHSIITENIVFFQSQSNLKKINIVYESKESNSLLCDRNMISTVIRNLLSNAIKFSYNDTNVYISVNKIDNKFYISVSDQGVGIKPQNIEKLFRIDNKHYSEGTAKERGTGLGLILCADFVEKHKGAITVKSELGKGSTFSIMLPINGF